MSNSSAISISEIQQPSKTETSAPHYLWLLSDYDSSAWCVTDARGHAVTIDFDIPLPDGTRLTSPENSHLLQTVKQYAVETRFGPQACTDDAHIQRLLATNLIYCCYWMRRHHIRSFQSIVEEDLTSFADDARFGVECLTDAAPRLLTYTTNLLKDGQTVPSVRRGNTRVVDTEQLLDDAGVPRMLVTNERVAWVVAHATNNSGFTLSIAQQPKLEQECPERTVLRSEPIRKIIRPLEDLYRMRFRIKGDNITFRPFAPNASAVAKRLGEASVRTPTVPYKQGLHLIDQAARWVLAYSDPLLELRDRAHACIKPDEAHSHLWESVQSKLDAVTQPDSHEGSPWPVVISEADGRKGTQLNRALRLLGTACVIIVAAMVGRRKEEILTAKYGCISRTSEGFWLETVILKTLQEIDKTPCPELVARAIQVLERLSEGARKLTGSPTLDQFTGVDPAVPMKLDLRLLNDFAEIVGIPKLPDGSVWIFSAHQFRRLFAITYMWRWAEGDLPSLSHHLRHLNLAMTRRYVTEAEAGAIFADTQRHLTHEILTEVAMGERILFGQEGMRLTESLKSVTEALRQRVRVVDRSRVGTLVERFIEKEGIVLQPNPWAFCARANSDAGKAACAKSCKTCGPDLSEAGPRECAACPFSVMSTRQTENLEAELAKDWSLANDTRLPAMLREAAQIRCNALREALTKAKP